jgi:hypothetical protein
LDEPNGSFDTNGYKIAVEGGLAKTTKIDESLMRTLAARTPLRALAKRVISQRHFAGDLR